MSYIPCVACIKAAQERNKETTEEVSHSGYNYTTYKQVSKEEGGATILLIITFSALLGMCMYIAGEDLSGRGARKIAYIILAVLFISTILSMLLLAKIQGI